MYNFKNVECIENFLNEIGNNIELKVVNSNDNLTILKINEFGEVDIFENFYELNKYANEQLEALMENDLDAETFNELIEEFTLKLKTSY